MIAVLGFAKINWITVADLAAGIAAVVNAVVVIILAWLNARLVKSSEIASKAAVESARASNQSVEDVLLERRETFSFQKATFHQQTYLLMTEINNWINVLRNNLIASRHQCSLLPDKWEVCREFVARVSPETSLKLHVLEAQISTLEAEIESYVRNPMGRLPTSAQVQLKNLAGLLDQREGDLRNIIAETTKAAGDYESRHHNLRA